MCEHYKTDPSCVNTIRQIHRVNTIRQIHGPWWSLV